MTRCWPLVLLAAAAGCLPSATAPGVVQVAWGKQGLKEGDLQKPRAIAIGPDQALYLVDMTARIQVYDADGQYLRG
ncbi:hypothetical protein OAS39_13565, partial [Pirellulales bacterium]|nr:hypothetical protein [Pirellulales bacterium]